MQLGTCVKKSILLYTSIIITVLPMKLWFSGILLCVISGLSIQAQTVDTISVYSPSMNKQFRNVLILPKDTAKTPHKNIPLFTSYMVLASGMTDG